MSERESYSQGVPCWTELSTTNIEGAKSFYQGLFGWEIQDTPMGPDFTYSVAKVNGGQVSGLYQQDNQEMPPNWLTYLAARDVDEIAKRTIANGGTVISEPMDVADMGRMIVIADPTGAVLGAWQAKQMIGSEIVNEPSTVVWNEVMTNDTDAALKFYSNVFDLGAEQMDGPVTYYTLTADGNQACGMMKMTEQMGNMPPAWAVYFNVESMDNTIDKINQLGGRVLVPPMESPYGMFSVISDPQGAIFNVIEGTQTAN